MHGSLNEMIIHYFTSLAISVNPKSISDTIYYRLVKQMIILDLLKIQE